ncbi:MAG: hypothetical protein RI897_1450 [Verrucomicrobiota bacterium]
MGVEGFVVEVEGVTGEVDEDIPEGAVGGGEEVLGYAGEAGGGGARGSAWGGLPGSVFLESDGGVAGELDGGGLEVDLDGAAELGGEATGALFIAGDTGEGATD